LMFQDSDDQLIGPTVLEDVEFGPLNMGIEREEGRRRAVAALAALRVSALADRAIRSLSGGQKRLVALAGLIALQPRLLLLDEPTASLDAVSASHIIEALDNLPCAMLLVSHDPICVQALSTRRLLLCEGVLSEATTRID
jgi:cobalt/nickel transport system ATP-binding protein